jgi:hypothetical protein
MWQFTRPGTLDVRNRNHQKVVQRIPSIDSPSSGFPMEKHKKKSSSANRYVINGPNKHLHFLNGLVCLGKLTPERTHGKNGKIPMVSGETSQPNQSMDFFPMSPIIASLSRSETLRGAAYL